MEAKQNPLPVCFLCLKRIDCSTHAEDAENSDSDKVKFFSNKFFVFRHTYLDIPVEEFKNDIKSSTCQECQECLNLICHLYDDLCSIKLKLSKELERLADLLEYSKRRLSDKMIKIVMSALANQLTLEDEGALSVSLEEVDVMRTLLAQKCRLHSQPSSKPNAEVITTNDVARESGGDEARQHVNTPDIKEETESFEDNDDDNDELQNWDSHNNNENAVDVDEARPSSSRRRAVKPVKVALDIHEDEDDHDKLTDSGSDWKGDSSSEDNSADSEEKVVKKSRKKSLPRSVKTGLACDQCPKTYRRQGALEKHKFLVHGTKMKNGAKCLFSCDQCDQKFTTKWAIPGHKQRVHNAPPPAPVAKPYSCEKCPTRFSHKYSIHAHMKVVHGIVSFSSKDKPYKCDICGRGSTTAYGRVRHMQSVHGVDEKKVRKSHKCSTCSEEFVTRRQLVHHIYEIHKKNKTSVRLMKRVTDVKGKAGDDANETCVVCGLEFKSWILLQRHLEEHESQIPEEEKSKKCYFCHQSFSNEQSIWAHLRCSQSHDLTKVEFPCDHTDHLGMDEWVYENPSQLEEHFKQHHDGSLLYKCGDCHWPFLDKNMLDLHRIIHLSKVNGKYQCPVCGNFYLNDDTFQEHYNTVHGVSLKRYKCPICTWGFASKQGISLHMKIHEVARQEGDGGGDDGQRNQFLCSECPKTYSSAVQLKHHKRYIHVTKQCQECGLVMQVSRLRNHMQMVHGKEDHMCTICGKAYKIASMLKMHMSSHGQYKFYCQFCGNGARSGCHLRRHIRRMHKDQLAAQDQAPKQVQNKDKNVVPAGNSENI